MLEKLMLALILLTLGGIAGAMAGVRVAAQTQPRAPIVIDPKVIAGPDVGFIPTGFNGRTPTGRLVVRVNGQWVEVQLGGGVTMPVK